MTKRFLFYLHIKILELWEQPKEKREMKMKHLKEERADARGAEKIYCYEKTKDKRKWEPARARAKAKASFFWESSGEWEKRWGSTTYILLVSKV